MNTLSSLERRIGFWIVVASVAVLALVMLWQTGERRFENRIRQAEVRYSGERAMFASFVDAGTGASRLAAPIEARNRELSECSRVPF